jgi:hypothetical protein
MNSLASNIILALGGRNGVCICPAHDDTNPSLSIKDTGDDDVIVHCFSGCDFRDVKDELRNRGLLSSWSPSEADPERQYRREEERRERKVKTRQENLRNIKWCQSIWDASQESKNTRVQIHLAFRNINILSPTIRFHTALKHTDTGQYFETMMASVTHWPFSKTTGIHRTFLSPCGDGKARVPSPKKMAGNCGGGAVRLAAAGKTLAITEGIETRLSVQQATGYPTWAALSAGGMKALKVPPTDITNRIIICADNDAVGIEAANNAADNWNDQGYSVVVAVPPELGTDFNDMMKEFAA